ncbi:MAG: hypothetical protein ONB31_14120, partial [candidate division KSB1 bacterium]|nr:hypothetical protein [candidate division KSB1 bacterium]
MKRSTFIIGAIIFGLANFIHAQDILVKFKSKIDFENRSSLELAAVDASFANLPPLQIMPLAKRSLRRFQNLRKGIPDHFASIGIDRWTTIRLPRGTDTQQIIAALQAHPAIEFAQVNHVYRVHQLPNDPRIA